LWLDYRTTVQIKMQSKTAKVQEYRKILAFQYTNKP